MTMCVGMSELKGDRKVWERCEGWEVGWSGGMAGSGRDALGTARERPRERTGRHGRGAGALGTRTARTDAHGAHGREAGSGEQRAPRGSTRNGEAGEHSGAGAGGHVIREAGGMRGARERVRGGQGVREKREHSEAEFREARKLEF